MRLPKPWRSEVQRQGSADRRAKNADALISAATWWTPVLAATSKLAGGARGRRLPTTWTSRPRKSAAWAVMSTGGELQRGGRAGSLMMVLCARNQFDGSTGSGAQGQDPGTSRLQRRRPAPSRPSPRALACGRARLRPVRGRRSRDRRRGRSGCLGRRALYERSRCLAAQPGDSRDKSRSAKIA